MQRGGRDHGGGRPDRHGRLHRAGGESAAAVAHAASAAPGQPQFRRNVRRRGGAAGDRKARGGMSEATAMRVWIDADACPRAAKDQVIKFALKRRFEVLLVAGQSQVKPAFACVRLIVVPSGPDAADDYLVEHAEPGDLVICSDVPLADRLVKKGVAALDPRGPEVDEIGET